MINRKTLKDRAKSFLSGGVYIRALIFTAIVYLTQLSKIILDPETKDYYLYIDSLGVFFEKGIKIQDNTVAVVGILTFLFTLFFYPILKTSLLAFFIGDNRSKNQGPELDSPRPASYISVDREDRGNVILTYLSLRIKIFLWSLLFLIPGIIKRYEYYFVPYLLADDPARDRGELYEESARLSYGIKMQLFLLEMSFIGWYFIAAFLPGASFLVHPYKEATLAQAYMEVVNRRSMGDTGYDGNMNIGY